MTAIQTSIFYVWIVLLHSHATISFPQNSNHLNIIHTKKKKPIEKNGSWYQITAVTSIFFIFFDKTPFFLFCSSSFLFALFLFPFVLLSSQSFFFFFLCLCLTKLVKLSNSSLYAIATSSSVNLMRLHYLFYFLYIFWEY